MRGPGKQRDVRNHVAALKSVTGPPPRTVPVPPFTGGDFDQPAMAEWLASRGGAGAATATGAWRRPVAMHLCGRRLCFSPWHSVWGTDALNRQSVAGGVKAAAAARAAGLAASLSCLEPAAWLGLEAVTDARLGPAAPMPELLAGLQRVCAEEGWLREGAAGHAGAGGAA